MLRIAAIRQPVEARVNRNVVHIFLSCPPARPVSWYGPSASATVGARNRMVSIVIVRLPPVDSELANVPRTTASRPLRHSPEETSWSASVVKHSASAFASRCSRASKYRWTSSRISDCSPEFAFCAERSTAKNERRQQTVRIKSGSSRVSSPPPRAAFPVPSWLLNLRCNATARRTASPLPHAAEPERLRAIPLQR